MSDLSFPIGRFVPPAAFDDAYRLQAIDSLAVAPARLREAVDGLTAAQIDTPYRPGGWTVRQVVHHVPDSHLNAYVRFKLALTEDAPQIKAYDEAAWALLADTQTAAIETSLILLEALHDRWVRLIRGISAADFVRTYLHPEMGPVTLDHALGMYAWHGRHHVAHVTGLRARMGWS